MRRSTPALLFVLAAGSLSASTPLSALKAQESARAARAEAHLMGLRATQGLSGADGFQAHHPFTNPQGRAVVRFHQTHRGVRVWGGEAIVHVETDGRTRALTQGLQSGVTLEGSPKISAEQARTLALRTLAPKGPVAGATVEPVVFPSKMTGGFVPRWDASQGRMVLDAEMSVLAKAPAAPYVWAYEVATHLRNDVDGTKDLTFIVDGTTGAILRKTKGLDRSPSMSAPTSRPQGMVHAAADTPALGTGNSLYSGTVSLNTTLSSTDNTYSLLDTTRGTQPNPFLNNWGILSTPGLVVCYDHVSSAMPGWIFPNPYAGRNTTNTWGNGLPFNGVGVPWITDATGESYWQGAVDPIGETAAVDAMYGMAVSWDFYKNLWGRNGFDDQGTSIAAQVHSYAPSLSGDPHDLVDSDLADQYNAMIVVGDGTSSDAAAPGGSLPGAEPDLVGRNASLLMGRMSGLVGSGWWGEALPILDGTGDIFGKMIQAYAQRTPGQDGTVPDFAPANDPASWQVGVRAGKGTPQRWMAKPSLDGHSVDGWYDGIEVIYHKYGSGPIRRMFYFLSQGASSSASSDTHSAFLPGGMTGIGNDAATKIWYKAITEYLLIGSNYADAREAAIAAAHEIYGGGSAEETAVMNAFAAVNIGDAPGQPKRVKVSFPVVHPGGDPFTNTYVYYDQFARIQIFPTRTKVRVKCDVENTANTALTWSLGSYPQDGYGDDMYDQVGGTINADGTWTTPTLPINGSGFWVIKATSQADPAQFAKGRMLALPMDADLDAELDAMDLGLVAMSNGISVYTTPYPAASIWSGGTIGDLDIAAFTEAFTNAFPAK